MTNHWATPAVPVELADRIYEAAVVPEFWPDVLAALAETSGTAWSVLVSFRATGPRWIASSPEADDIARVHLEQFADNRRTAGLLAKPHAGFITDYDVLTQDEIDAEPVYQDFLIPRGYGFGTATHILPGTGDSIVVHCENRFAAGPVTGEAIERLDLLRPHLARSAVVAQRLSFERTRTAVETLSALGLAACAVGRAGSVLLANRDFDAERSYWTTRGGNRIALADRRADSQLDAALAVIETGAGVCSLPLVAADQGPPAVLHVVPVRRAAHDLFTRATAILVLTKASRAPTQGTSLLQALFDLSATEAQVAARISAGETAEQIADADGKSVGTVRNQLKSVLAKTGCRRQVDLARLLTQLIPAGA
jgi:DNA-binding CsgD family transcriptional regulator